MMTSETSVEETIDAFKAGYTAGLRQAARQFIVLTWAFGLVAVLCVADTVLVVVR